MRDSTLYIGALASNNVNNIVNDAGKYDEYKEKVKDLTKEIQTRKDTLRKWQNHWYMYVTVIKNLM